MRLHASRFLVAAIALVASVPAGVDAADLDNAWELFYDADFELALTELEELVSASEGGDRLREAHALAGQCHARLGQDDAAMDSFCSALAVEPAWNPDPTTFSVDELALYRRALTRCPQVAVPKAPEVDPLPGAPALTASEDADSKPWYKKKGFLIGAGALVVLAIAAGSGDDAPSSTNDAAPDFPDPPRAPGLGISW